MPKDVQWTGVDYPNSSIAQFNMSGIKFTEGNLANSAFESVNLEGTTFKYANMRNMQFTHVDLSGSNVNASNLSRMTIEGNAWWEMTMKECDVYGLSFSSGTIESAKIENSHLVDLQIENCEIDGLRINGVLIKELIENHPDYKCDPLVIPNKVVYDNNRKRVIEGSLYR